jgi:nucleoside-diphosphate-sugar epimerase
MSMPERVLAIGGTGFIGTRAVPELLRRGAKVAVFHRGDSNPFPEATALRGDRRRLLDHKDALRSVKPDVVLDFILSDAGQARDLIAVFQGFASRIVGLSSCDVYRATAILHRMEPGYPDNSEITETSPLRSSRPYPTEAIARLQGLFPWLTEEYDKIPVENELLAHPDLPGTILRLPMLYGPGDPLHRFYATVKTVDDNQPLRIPETLAQWRGIRGYVEDIAGGIALACLDPRAAGRVYNVGDPENFTELEWTQTIAAAAGFSGKIEIVPDSEMPKHLVPPGDYRQHWTVSSARIRNELGYSEAVPRSVALARTIAWERENPPNYASLLGRK